MNRSSQVASVADLGERGHGARRLRFAALIAAFSWTFVVGATLVWSLFIQDRNTVENARAEALGHFNKDESVRLWAASHGGVYVPVTDETPANEYLAQIPDRDVRTEDGKELTLMNPAYILRQVNERLSAQDRTAGHITSLLHRRPETAPDDWERSALEAFEAGAEEVAELAEIDGELHYRFMRPMFVSAACLKCHGDQGYEIGDVRGGMSVSVGMAVHYAAARATNTALLFGHGGLWLIGLIGILLGTRQGQSDLNRHHDNRRRLRDSENRFRRILEQSSQAIAIYDPGGRVITNNKALLAMWGITLAESERIRQEYRLFDDPLLREAGIIPYLERVKAGEAMDLPLLRYDAALYPLAVDEDLKALWIKARAYPVFDESGVLAQIVVFQEDVTMQVRAERELAASRERAVALAEAAEDANRAKGDFLANMSHEIRTLLNGIVGMTRLLKDSGLASEQREFTETIEVCGHSLLDLVNQVLDLSKIEAGKLELERLPYDPELLSRDCLGILDQTARAKGLSLALVIDTPLPERLWGDPTRIRQMLLNLLSNAVKFTSQGGVTLILRSGLEEQGRRVLTYLVEDSGIGIPEARIDQIFESFTQADSSTTRRFGGTGLGLAITRELARLMGGSLGVENREQGGARFWFTLPLEPAQVEAQASEPDLSILRAERGPFTAPGPRILLVEDNAVNSLVARQLLERMLGCRVVSVGNGKEAMDQLAASEFDLVLMDCQMPVMDGYTATRLIREGRDGVLNPQIPIVALTAQAFQKDRELCFAAGMNDYVVKPVEFEALASAIRENIDQTTQA